MRDGHFLRNCWIVHVMKPGMKGAAPHVTSENFQLDQWTQILESYSTSFLSKLYPFQTSNVPSQWQIEIEGFYYRVLLGLSRRPLQESPFFFSTRHFDCVITSHLTSHLTERHRCTRTVPWMLSSKSQRRRGAWADSQLSASRKSEKETEMFIPILSSYQFLIVETQIPDEISVFFSDLLDLLKSKYLGKKILSEIGWK